MVGGVLQHRGRLTAQVDWLGLQSKSESALQTVESAFQTHETAL